MDDESVRMLAEYLAGSTDAAAHIFDKYVQRLVALAQSQLSSRLQSRVDPEDIVQSAYRSFFRRAANNEYTLKRSGDLWRLLAAFTINKAKSRVERELANKRNPGVEEHATVLLDEALQAEPTPEEAAILVDQLTSFMMGLTPRDRRILELRLQGESIEAIGDQIGKSDDSEFPPQRVSVATVRRVLRNARLDLERQLFRN